ncbi:MAG: hypothetical protein KDC54_16585, partial [Lewinella sp.]|nr:hypothetical protein [Lewinella sp.]
MRISVRTSVSYFSYTRNEVVCDNPNDFSEYMLTRRGLTPSLLHGGDAHHEARLLCQHGRQVAAWLNHFVVSITLSMLETMAHAPLLSLIISTVQQSTRAGLILVAMAMIGWGFRPAPAVALEEICDNAIDDDNDGLIDLNDPDCDCAVIEP